MVCPDPAPSVATAKSPAPARTIDIDLPKAMGSTTVILSVEIGADGKTSVAGVPAKDDAAITEAAKKARAANPEVKGVLFADPSTPHRRVVAVLDALILGGVSRVAFGIRPEVWPQVP